MPTNTRGVDYSQEPIGFSPEPTPESAPKAALPPAPAPDVVDLFGTEGQYAPTPAPDVVDLFGTEGQYAPTPAPIEPKKETLVEVPGMPGTPPPGSVVAAGAVTPPVPTPPPATRTISDYLTKDQQSALPEIVLTRLVDAGAPLSVQLAYTDSHPDMWERIPTTHMKALNAALVEYNKLRGEEQFEKAKELGFVPEDAVYIKGGKDGEWGYTSVANLQAIYDAAQSSEQARRDAPAVERFQREHMQLPSGEWVNITEWNKTFEGMDEDVASRYVKVALDPKRGLTAMGKVMEQDVKAFESKHLKLRDGKWVAIDQWNELPERYQTIGIRRGYDDMVESIKAEQERYDTLMSGLDRFAIKEPLIGPLQKGEERPDVVVGYNIAGFLQRHPEHEDLVKEFFPPGTSEAAVKFNKEMEQGAKTEELYRDQRYVNVAPLADGTPAYGMVLTPDQLSKLKGSEQGKFVRDQPALILPADPKWQRLKDRPDSDPEKQAYKRQWQDKLIDFATAVSIATTPVTMGAIGAVGKALTIPKVATWAFNIGRVGVKPAAVAASVINPVVRSAVSLAKLANLAPFALGASRIVDEARIAQLQTDWQTFQSLSATEKNKWADEAGYGKPFDQLTDNQKSAVLVHYSNPPDVARQDWLNLAGEKIGALNDFAAQKAEWLQKHAPAPISNTVTFLGGAAVGVIEGAGYMASIPLLAANLSAAVPLGTAPSLFRQTASGMVDFFAKDLPLAFAANPALAAGRVTGLFLLSPQASLKLAKSGLVRVFSRYVPERAMAIEISTPRIRYDQLAEFARLSVARRIKLAAQAVDELLRGKKYATIAGTSYTIKVRNVPYQEIVGNTLWNFSDRPLEAGSKLYTSPQAAVRFGISTAGGKIIKRTTLNEIRVPDNFKPNMEKLLSRGEAELESIFGKDVKFEPIPGRTGKGVSTNVTIGPYPIRRFTLVSESLLGLEGVSFNWGALAKRVAKLKDIVIDLDKTLVDSKGKLYPGAKDFLSGLKSQGKDVTLWTHSTKARTNAILNRNDLKGLFNKVITREKYEPTGKNPDAFKDIRKVDGEILIDNSPVQAKHYAEVGLKNRFVSPSMDYPVTKLTPATLALIRLKAGEAALGDLIKGWSGRADVLKQILRVDPRTTRLEIAAKRLKTEKPYSAISDNVKTQRSPVPHPDLKGELKERVRLITYNQAGDAVFLGLDRSAPSFEFMGGSANPAEILLQSGKWHNFNKSGRPLNWGEAARSQLIGESNMQMPRTEYVGTYLGKINDNALHGARVYKGAAVGQPDIVKAWNRFQRRKFGYNTPELKAGVWLFKDGTVKGVAGLKTSATEAVRLFNELGANPATKDLLAYVAKADGFKVDSVKMDAGNKWLLKTRDAGFADRAISGKPLTPKQIAGINKAEIKFLKQRRLDIAKGTEPAILDYLTAEGELRTVAELLHGRRKAVSIKPNEPLRQKMDTAIIEMIKKDTRSTSDVAKDLLAKGKTKEAVRVYEKTATQNNTVVSVPKLSNAIQSHISKLVSLDNRLRDIRSVKGKATAESLARQERIKAQILREDAHFNNKAEYSKLPAKEKAFIDAEVSRLRDALAKETKGYQRTALNEALREIEARLTRDEPMTDLYNRLKKEAEEAVRVTKERVYDQYGDYLYSPDVHASQYTAWLQRYTAAALANRPLDMVRAREGESPAQLSRILAASREFDRPYVASRAETARAERAQGASKVERVERAKERASVEQTGRAEPAPTTVSRITPDDLERVVPVSTEPDRITPPRGEPEPVPPPRVEPRTPPTPPPPPPPPAPRVRPEEPDEPSSPPTVRLQTQSPMSQPVPDGSIAWRQGLFWKYIPPPWTQNKPITLPKGLIPTGAVKTDLRTPSDTVQMIGRSRTANVPQTITTDLGTVDIKVSERGRRIEFTGRGLETNVGTRISSTTKGMSIPAEHLSPSKKELDDADTALSSSASVSRHTISKTKPTRKKRKTNWLTELTSVGRIR